MALPQKRTLTAIVGAVVAAATIAFTSVNEGTRNTPYRDSGGKWTICTGQTGVPMHYYTNAQCDSMLANSLAATAAQIEAVTPGFVTLPEGVKVATLDFTYNVGVGAYGKSTYRDMLIKKQLPAACDQLLRWRMVGDKDCSLVENAKICGGIWTRRKAEAAKCRGQ